MIVYSDEDMKRIVDENIRLRGELASHERLAARGAYYTTEELQHSRDHWVVSEIANYESGDGRPITARALSVFAQKEKKALVMSLLKDGTITSVQAADIIKGLE